MTRTLVISSRGSRLNFKVTTPDASSLRRYVKELRSNGYTVRFKAGAKSTDFSGRSGK